MRTALACEKIRLINLLPNHKEQVKEFIDQQAVQVDTHQKLLLEGAKSLTSAKGETGGQQAKDTIEASKTLIIKEMIANPGKESGFAVSPLVENIRLEMKQEQQRQQFIDQRMLQQQMQRNNQRVL